MRTKAAAPARTEAPLLDAAPRIAGRLDARFFALLAALAATGSLVRAARTAGYSYKGAWLVLDVAANLAGVPLVQSATGGAGGGGTRPTPEALALLDAWQRLQSAQQALLREHEAWWRQQPQLRALFRRWTMKVTARNQFAGRIARISAGDPLAEVALELRGGQQIVAWVSAAEVKALKLKKGLDAVALVKAPAVVLIGSSGDVRFAGNQLAGTVSRISRGAVSALVGITLPGGTVVTASVTNDAVEALDLAVGQDAVAAFPASAVMLGVE